MATFPLITLLCISNFMLAKPANGENDLQNRHVEGKQSSLYQILTDYIDLKSEIKDLKYRNEISQMKETIELLEAKILVLEQMEVKYSEMRWNEWGPWGSCAASCSGGVGERLQSRTRYRKVAVGTEAPAQTESRPCNSVQFASCKHPNNTDRFFAVSYGFENTLAQATCTAIASGGYVNAVRRTCDGSAPDCAAVCTSVGRKCFNSLHVYSGIPPTQPDTVGQKVLQMFRYNGCGGGCGPNFCCCKNK